VNNEYDMYRERLESDQTLLETGSGESLISCCRDGVTELMSKNKQVHF
jgi:hypothetical protein